MSNSPIQVKDPIPSYPFNYRGVVEDDVDPLNAGRVRVRVYPMFTSLPVLTLPWAVPAPRIVSGAGNGYGEYATPEVGSWVYVFFEAGDIQQPVYFASAPSATYGLPTVRGKGIKTIQTKNGTTLTLNDNTGDVRVATSAGMTFELTAAGKVKLGSTGVDLITILSDLLGMFRAGTGQLVADPQGAPGAFEFLATAPAAIAALKLQLDTLKV